jgi:hypothetical protein
MSARQKRQTPLAGGASQVPSTDQSAPIVAASAEDAKALTSRGNSVHAQEQRILAALRIRPHTTDDFRRLGIFQISARIWGLRAKGWDIRTDRVTVVDRDSYTHPRAALYSLVEEVPA